ncbi:LicD family protein [Glaciecola sp. MF2-115]|uniref:LicD family protein n=1 Tax=Glaciecola sp. MF2-115 TaxID=3384827 RepID=UPI0039A04E7C
MREQNEAKLNAVIFGAGEAGCAAYELLQGQFHIRAFVDNDAAKHGSELQGIQIIGPEDIRSIGVDKILIASEYSEQIEAQLKSMGLEQDIEVLSSRYLKAIDFSAPEVREKAIQALLALCAILNKTNIRYYVDAGTLLGIVRDGDLIPWDDDLDIALHADDLAELAVQLPDVLEAMQEAIGVQYSVNTHMNNTAFGAVAEGAVRSLKLLPVDLSSGMPMIDVFVKYIDGDNMDYCLASRGIRMPAIHFSSHDELLFRQQIIKLPYDHKAYLQTHYGDWQTPKPDWSLSELDNSTLF